MIIRFPPYVDLRQGKPPMARFISWLQRVFQKPPANVAAIRIARARRERRASMARTAPRGDAA